MAKHRVFSALISGIILAAMGSVADRADANEVLKVIPWPSSTTNVAAYPTTLVFTVQVQMTSGQPDSVQMYYSCTDSNSTSLSCTPGGSPSDTLSVSKTSPATDSCTVDISTATPPVYFSAYAVGVNGGGSNLYNQPPYSRDAQGAQAAPGAAAPALATPVGFRQNLRPTIAFGPLQDYVVNVQAAFNAGNDPKVQMTYRATMPGPSNVPVSLRCTPSSETMTVHDYAAPLATHAVLIHAYGLPSTTVITFTATAKSPLANVTVNSNTVTYTIPNAPSTPPAPPAAVPPPNPEPLTPPTGLVVYSYKIAPTNQYVAAVTFPIDPVESHIRAFYYAWPDGQKDQLFNLFPDKSNVNITKGILQTQNVLIDCTSQNGVLMNGVLIDFQVDGVAAHAGPFVATGSFTPQAQ